MPPPVPEAGWMASRMQQPDNAAPPAVVPELDNQAVRIGGYVVPLDFDATKMKEFLLVPFVGACIHVPPPPPNQIIYVKAEDGFEVKGQFDPVYVTGTLKTARQFTGLAATGYTMDAEKVRFAGIGREKEHLRGVRLTRPVARHAAVRDAGRRLPFLPRSGCAAASNG